MALNALARQTTPCVQLAAQLKKAGLDEFHAGRALTDAEMQAYGLGPFELPAGTKAFLLGDYGSTANVFRIQPPQGEEYELKVFRSVDRNQTGDPRLDHLRRDRHWLEKFAAASKHDPTETLEVMPVLQSLEDKHALKLKGFKGHTLVSLLNLDGEHYDKLIAEYNKRLGVFVADCRADGIDVQNGPEDYEHPDVKTYFIRVDGEKLEIGNLHNVLFDPKTGRFMLFDPF